MNTSQTTQNATQNGRSASELMLAFFTSPLFMMLALGLALLAQGKHTADVFAFWSHMGTPEWLFYAFAGAVEIAVFIFVLHDHKRTSYAFAVGAFATNVVYYAIGGANLLSAELAPVLLLSVLLPGVIVGYSHTIAEKPAAADASASAKPAKANARPWWQRLMFWRKTVETPVLIPTANSTTPAPIVNPGESGGHGEDAAQTSETSAQPEGGETTKPAKLSPAQRQDIIIARGYKTTAEVMQAFNIKERAANGDLAEVRKSLLQTNGTGAH